MVHKSKMVHKFLVFTVSVAAIFVQVHGLGIYNEGPTPRNDAEKLLQKLEETDDNALVKAQEELDAAAKKVNATAETVQSAAVSQMQGIEQKLQQEIDELKQKAAKAGVNIDACLKGNEDDLVNLPNTLSNDMVHCISDRIIEGISYAQDALNKAYADESFPEPKDALAPEPRNKVDDLLKKLREKVDEAMVKAHKALEDAKNKVNEVADKVQNAAKQQMQGIENDLRAELDKLKQKAKNAGVNIDDCLGGNEDRLVNLPNQLSNDMVHCVSDKINKGISFAEDALNQIQKIVDEVENLKKEIKDCGHGLHAVKCLAKLALKIEQDITTLPTKIEADVAATALLISKLQEEVQKCASQKVDQCENDGKKILAEIAACVAKKIIT